MVHNPEKIALLCGSCHDRITRNVWSKDLVAQARRNPKTFKRCVTKDAFDFKEPFNILIGNNCFKNIRCIIRKSTGEEWFSIDPPESYDAPPRLSVKFFGPNGQPELEIYKNEWQCSTGVWDLRIRGPIIELYAEAHKIMLRLKARPPHGLEINYLNMFFKDTGIVVNTDGTVFLTIAGTEITMKGSDMTNAEAIFSLP